MVNIVFIHKKTLRVVDAMAYPVDGGITPNHGTDFYIVTTDIVGNPGDDWSEIINSQLPLLREKYPDTIEKYTDFDGVEYESITYGKYSEDGFCCEPWEFIKESEVING